MDETQNNLLNVLSKIKQAERQHQELCKCIQYSGQRKIRIDCGSENAGIYPLTTRIECESILMSKMLDGMIRAVEDELDSLRNKYRALLVPATEDGPGV